MKSNSINRCISSLIIAIFTLTAVNAQTNNIKDMENLNLTSEWDKTFPKSDKVNHRKVTFPNRYGITLAADMYTPKNAVSPLPAIAVCGPFGAVKEQAAGLYAQEMAERGFITLAFDPSFTGESGGQPRYMTSPDINTEDFSAAVDFLVTNPAVNPEAVGIIGICGWGGIAINAAAADPRIKATVASTMYDMSRVNANGYFDSADTPEDRDRLRSALAAQRTEDFRNGSPKLGGGVPDVLPEDAPKFLRDYFDYYKTPRGYHSRSLNSNGGRNATSPIPWINFPLMSRAGEIKNAVMIVHGEKAHSFYFGSDAYKKLTVIPGQDNNKLFMVIPGASHTDLYDQKDVIPFDALVKFFGEYLK
ncbi:MAG: alpha/beta hydrolase [Muribaculaceae bacterium]|nr:alpha/beta hydrolase [Muribaculaceae bacterium]